MNEPGRDVQERAERTERRRHYRADLEAGAMVHVANVALKSRIVDLSLGGVRLRRVEDGVPCPAIGTMATLELEIGGRGWVVVHGFIQRVELDELVIAFGALPADVEDLIEDEVLAAVEAEQRPRMLVVDREPERRRRVAEKLRAAGCESYEASTPLEAIDLMERPRSHISGVAVSEHLTQTGADEFCDFVAQTNPHIKLALIAEALAEGTRESQAGANDDDVTGDAPRARRVSERIATVVPSDEDTMERSLRGFVRSLAPRARGGRR